MLTALRSTRSSSRARTAERGFVLGMAMVIAVLYFLLMELLLIDSSRALGEAQRFRSRVVATTLAENGAELAAERMVHLATNEPEVDQSVQGDAGGEYTRNGNPLAEGGAQFELHGSGKSKGVAPASASLMLEGTIRGNRIAIEWARYSQ